MNESNTFTWLDEYQPRSLFERELLRLYHEAQPKPKWTPEIDAALRIIMCAAKGNLASQAENEAIVRTLSTKISRKKLYNSDLILLAFDILSNEYFFCTPNALANHSHQQIVARAQRDVPVEHRMNLYVM